MLTKLSFYFIHSLRAKVIGLSLLVSLIPLISVLILRALSLSYAEDVTTSAATTAIESINKQALGYAQARAKALNERAEYIEKEAIRLSKKISCIYEEPEKLPKKIFPNLQYNYDPKGYFWNSHLDGRMTALLPPMNREEMEVVHRFELLEVDFRRLIQKEAYIPNILVNTKQHGLYTYPPVNMPAKIGAEILKLPIPFNLTPKFSNNCKTDNCSQPVWTKAYYDQLGDRGWTVTCFSPVYNKEGVLVAYVGIDLSIDNLVDQFISSQITAQSYTFVIDGTGYEMGLTAKAREDFAVPKRDTSYNLLQFGNNDCKQVVEKMLSGNDGLLGKFILSGKTKYVLLATVAKTGWKLAIVVPEADPLIPLIPIYQSLRTEEKKLEKMSIYLLFFTFFGVLVATIFVANRFVTPIQNLSDATKKLGTNFQHIQIKVKGRDEVAELTKAFNEMGKQLESKIEAFAELYRIAITLSSATSLKEIDWNVVENIANLIKAKSCRLLLSDKLYMSINESPLIFSRSLINPNIYVKTVSQTELIKNYSCTKKQRSDDSKTVTVPLLLESRCIGVVIAQGKKDSFSQNEVDCLSIFATQMAEGIVRILRFEKLKLQTIELEQKNQELVRLNKIKSDFLSVVTHELRTPVASMVGWLSLLEDELRDEVLKEYLKNCQTAANSQMKLIRDLLDMVRVENGSFHLSITVVDLNIIALSAIETVKPLAFSKNIKISTNLQDLPEIDGDSCRLEQVVLNLLTNSIKFTPNDGSILVSTELRENFVVIEVADNGIGIEPEFQPFVFEKFRQADGTITRRYGGLGIGLALVKEIIDKHNGKIELYSSPGIGTRFRIQLRQKLCSRKVEEQEQSFSVK